MLLRTLGVKVAPIVALVLLCYLVLPDYYLFDANLVLLAVLGAIALNVLTGYAGLVSIGNAAFLALGAYSAAILGPHLTFLPTLLCAGLLAGAVGAGTGIAALRFRGLYLILATLALHFVVIFALTELDSRSGATEGGRPVPTASLLGLVLDTDRRWFLVLLVAAAVVTLCMAALVNGRPGRAYKAIRAGELNAAIAGVDIRRTKLGAFALTSFIIGVQGALYGYYIGRVTYSYFTVDLAVSYAAMILIGGLGSITGAVLGAAVVTLLPLLVTNVGNALLGTDSLFVQNQGPELSVAVYAALVLAILIVEPRGLVGLGARVARAGRSLGALLARRGRRPDATST